MSDRSHSLPPFALHPIANRAKCGYWLAGLLLPWIWGPASVAAQTLPQGFRDSIIISGLYLPTAVRFARDGRIFVAEKSGVIKLFDVFGPESARYASAGDGASFTFADYGQGGGSPGSPTPANPCGDPRSGVGGVQSPPTAEEDALRGQDLRTSGDPVAYNGAILPFRFRIRPGTREVWIGKLGWLAPALPIDGPTRGSSFLESGDANNTRRPVVPSAFAVPQLAVVPADLSPGTLAYALRADSSPPCEGNFLIQTASGPRCLGEAAP